MRKRTYTEDRGSFSAAKHTALKWTLFPTMGVLLLSAVAIETGALQGSREAYLRRLLKPASHAALLQQVETRVVVLDPYIEGVKWHTLMRLDGRRSLECRLHGSGDISALIRDAESRHTGNPWAPGAKFQAPIDALCGAMISSAIDRMDVTQ